MRRMTAHDTQEEQPGEYPEQPENMTDMQAEQEKNIVTNLRPTVGDELRIRREQAGQTTHEVAEAVRIQRRYLEALEGGRLEDLPGTVYALGFLRTYAEYLGLDGDEFVTRYKEETEGNRRTPDYVLPEPIGEAKVPTAAIVIVAIVVALGAYVAWYSLRPQEAEITGAMPEVSGQLATVAEEPVPAQTPVASEPPVVAATPTPAPEPQPAPEPPAEAAASPEAPAVAPNVDAETPPPETAPAAAAVVEEPAAPTEPEAPPAAAAAETPAAEQVATVTPPETLETVAPSAPAVDEAPYVPQAFGAENTNARIVITAADDAWIEISDPDGNRLLSRTLRAGDSYRVPDREGLVFVTGNAGGLNIAVDGQPAPAIGGIGIVRKNVKLDPELLKQGRAWP